ncbi:MAG TPA: hypothetical protein V6C81_04445 [Planktothrix sp.]
MASFKWEIKEAVEDAYVIADLDYSDQKNEQIRVKLKVEIDLKSLSPTSTSIRWSGQYEHWCDAQSVREIEGVVNDWISLKMSTPEVAAVRIVDQEPAPELIVESHPEPDPPPPLPSFESKRPTPLTYQRLRERILSYKASSSSWLIDDEKKNQWLLATFKTREETYSGELIFEGSLRVRFSFEAVDEGRSLVTWTYSLGESLVFHPEIVERIEKITEDWIKIVLN